MKAKQLTVLIKPASGLCQLSCRYCFYRDLIKFGDSKLKMMQEKTVSALIATVADSLDKLVVVAGHHDYALEVLERIVERLD